MKLWGEQCCACKRWTVYSISFLGTERVFRVPCCDGCQAGGLTEDLRLTVIAAANDRVQAQRALAPLVMN